MKKAKESLLDELCDGSVQAGVRTYRWLWRCVLGLVLAASGMGGGIGITRHDAAENARANAIQDLRIINLENERLNLKADLFERLAELEKREKATAEKVTKVAEGVARIEGVLSRR